MTKLEKRIRFAQLKRTCNIAKNLKNEVTLARIMAKKRGGKWTARVPDWEGIYRTIHFDTRRQLLRACEHVLEWLNSKIEEACTEAVETL